MSATANTEAKSFDLKGFISKFAIVFILALFVVVLAIITSGRFLNYKNLINVIVQVAPIGIIALGLYYYRHQHEIEIWFNEILPEPLKKLRPANAA